MSLGDTNMRDFSNSIKYYMKEFDCSNARPGELNKKEFLKFWEKFDELYKKIDANKGICFFNLYVINCIL